MGAQLLPLPVTATAPPPPSPFLNLKFPVPKRRRFANSPPTAAPRWDSNAETVRTQRFRFNDFVSDDDDDDDEDYEFDFGRKEEQRTWWFDDSPGIDDDGEFEFWEESVDGFGVVFKVFRAFGWMLPAIAISMLLGTGPNALIMALALPLGQTALSLAIDKVWGRTSNRPKPRSQTKKKPFSQAARNTRMNEEKRGENKENCKGRETYKSWVGAPDGSVKGSKTAPSFGGWDELDKEGVANKTPRRVPDGPPRQQKKSKLSRRNRETPLLLRLLIAVFPFLGSWAKLL